MKRLGTGLDTVSIEEVRIGLSCGFKEDDITFTPNGVSFKEIEEAYNLKVKINLDSLESIKDFSKKYNSYPISIRINPNILAGGILQVNQFIGLMFASSIVGAISWLYYADRIVQLPLGVFVISISTVLLTVLSKEQLKNTKIKK